MAMRKGGQLLVECLLGLGRTGAVLDLAISPEALTPRQTLSQMRDAALASQKAVP